MKNNKALIALFVAVIVCLMCLFTACNDNSQDARDPQIVAIYNSYVADAAEKGETPLSYEQWLNSIKGAKGDTGAQGEQGIQGEKGEKGDQGETGATGRIGFIVSSAEQFKAAVTVDNTYVLLLNDITLENSVVVNKNVVIDLGGHTLTATGRNALQVSGENAYALVKNGNIVATNGGGLWGIEKGTLVVEDLNVTAQENSLGAHQAGNVIVNSGTYTSKDNFVIMTNGTVSEEKGDYGHNKIVVNGGTFNGNIQSAGYIAGGVYVANSDEVIVNGGTFNITNGVGIVARSGKTVVGENVVINLVEGSAKAGWVGDKKINIPTGKELVLDLASDYPGGQPSIENNTTYSVFTVEAASTQEELVALIADSSVDNIVIANDVVVTGELKIGASRVCTVDLNGHTVSLVYAEGVTPTNGGVFNVAGKKSHLTINDSSKDQTGKVVGSDKTFANKVTCAVRVGNYGKLTINGGHFYGTSEDTSCIFVNTSRSSASKATVVINGGTFETTNSDGKTAYVLNHQDSSTTGCTITVNGGTFKNYNPGVTQVDPSNASTGKIVLGEGCKTTENTDGTDTWYTVSK